MLLLADPQDSLVPVGTAYRLAEVLPDARLQLVEGAGHHLPKRAPAAVTAGVLGLTTASGARLALFRGFLVRMPKERV